MSKALRLATLVTMSVTFGVILVFQAESASASNRCTRYVGAPGGVFGSGTCPSLTGWGTISIGGAKWSKTNSTARRDENFIDPQSTVCGGVGTGSGQHLHLRYSNGAGNTSSFGCVNTWLWGDDSGSAYVASWCGVHNNSNHGGNATPGQCYTKWTL